MRNRIVVEPRSVAVGGDMIAKDENDKIVFVSGATLGERVEVEIDLEKKDFSKGHVVKVLESTEARINPICPNVIRGCGGCDWAHISLGAQHEYKRAMILDSLTRISKVSDADSKVWIGPELSAERVRHRNSIRVTNKNGQPAYRKAKSHDLVSVSSCEVAVPEIDLVLSNLDMGMSEQITIRYGQFRDDLGKMSPGVLMLCEPTAKGVTLMQKDLGFDVAIFSAENPDKQSKGGAKLFFEVVGERVFEVGADSFFQTRNDGGEILVQEVGFALGHTEPDSKLEKTVLIDLYAGVGLFGASLGHHYANVLSVEQHKRASKNSLINTAHLANCEIISADVNEWRPDTDRFDGFEIHVIADPARSGLGQLGVDTIANLGPNKVVLISCDAGSMGRDVRLLIQAGFTFMGAELIDMFTDTSHVEVISLFERN